MPYPKEWDDNPAYELHIQHWKNTHNEEVVEPEVIVEEPAEMNGDTGNAA